MNKKPSFARRSLAAFLFAVPIAIAGGLLGLGGAEFRLPVLMGLLGYSARRAIPINLAVSLTTLAAALATRAQHLPLSSVMSYRETIGGMMVCFRRCME